MEDQSTDQSDLTDTGERPQDEAAKAEETKPAAAGAPVGKRGRHRTFRPRRVSTPAPAEAAAGTAVEPEATPDATTTAADVEPTADDDGATAEPVAGDEDAAAELEPADDDVKLRVRKPVGRRLAVTVAVAAVLFVAAGAFGGAMLQPYLADRVVANTKLDIAQTAKDGITTLFTYTPDDMEQLPARSAKYLGGDLKDSYTKQVDALAATNKQSQIHRSAQVVGTAVESLDGNNATAMVYANVTYTSAATKDVPRLFLVSYRLSMQRKGSDWVIVNMPWITSKDLTRVTP